MAKRIFWRPTNVSEHYVSCAPCPFVGVTINDMDEFIDKILIKTLFVPDGGVNEDGRPTGKYPCVNFSTKNDRYVLMFAGANRVFKDSPVNEKGRPAKWALYDEQEERVVEYYFLQREEDKRKVWSLFDDDAEIQSRIDLISTIVNRDGGISIHIR